MSCDCDTLIVGEAGPQGPQGLSGTNGTNGTNGVNAFTTTSASFTQPSDTVTSVAISVAENRWIALSQPIYISGAGFYRVTSVGGSPYTSISCTLIKTDGISGGASVSSGRKVSASSTAVYTDPINALNVNGDSALDGSVTINDSGADKDVRIEGDTDTNLLRTDASADRVGVGIAVPESKFHVAGGFKVGTAASGADSVFTGGVTVNDNGSSTGDFRVKGDTNAAAIFVDASADMVGIGTATPAKLLDVAGYSQINALLVNPNGASTVDGTQFVLQVKGASSGVPLIVDATNNRVGIKNSTPAFELDVTGTTNLNGALQRKAPVTKTADFSVATNENWIIVNKGSTAVVTLPTASSWTGREIMIKTIQAQAVDSASSNVVPLAGGAAGTSILTGTAGKFATLVSDGTNWIIMAGN